MCRPGGVRQAFPAHGYRRVDVWPDGERRRQSCHGAAGRGCPASLQCERLLAQLHGVRCDLVCDRQAGRRDGTRELQPLRTPAARCTGAGSKRGGCRARVAVGAVRRDPPRAGQPARSDRRGPRRARHACLVRSARMRRRRFSAPDRAFLGVVPAAVHLRLHREVQGRPHSAPLCVAPGPGRGGRSRAASGRCSVLSLSTLSPGCRRDDGGSGTAAARCGRHWRAVQRVALLGGDAPVSSDGVRLYGRDADHALEATPGAERPAAQGETGLGCPPASMGAGV